MFGRAWRIGRIAGIPVNVDSSWIWIAVLAVYSLWTQLAGRYPSLGSFTAFALAVLAASMIYQGARAAREQIGLRRRLSGATVGDAMDPPPIAIPGDMSLSEALDR